jgi:predicted transcriptional regulator
VIRTRLNVFIERDHARRLDELAVLRGLSKSAIVAAALAEFLSPEGTSRREAAIARRLDQLARQLDRLERDQSILIETIALYVRYTFSVAIPLPEAHHEAMRAQGKVRYAEFVEQLGRHLQRGGSFLRELHNEIAPDEGQFFADPAESANNSPEAPQ